MCTGIVPEYQQDDLINGTIEYWIDFFKELDMRIGQLKEKRLLNIIDKNTVKDKEWKGIN